MECPSPGIASCRRNASGKTPTTPRTGWRQQCSNRKSLHHLSKVDIDNGPGSLGEIANALREVPAVAGRMPWRIPRGQEGVQRVVANFAGTIACPQPTPVTRTQAAFAPSIARRDAVLRLLVAVSLGRSAPLIFGLGHPGGLRSCNTKPRPLLPRKLPCTFYVCHQHVGGNSISMWPSRGAWISSWT